ncbi:tRNA dihydrouridine synthase DusB [Sphaerisporangium dianthi]|uniref:tRNA-dihydrouridine synthase n=1 Tax=Sphaerisporangium dianthi TaxID=1436120 RepID=A0ABV9CK04_9ACTN
MKIGAIEVWPPVVLAPMAGVTNAPFRALCREQGGGLYVSEMITTRALVERNAKTLAMIRFEPGEKPRSLQLYGVDPAVVGAAVTMVAAEGLADHVDLNFGCPVPKVTRRGGGSALPYKRDLLRRILRAAVAAAGTLPVTVKMRKGIDDDHLTYLDAGRIAAEEGVSAVALHARTAVQHYGGTADWDAIARLKEAVPEIPVLGNGDIWTADDAVRMMRHTGCDGVVVGRGCLGRPWLFRDLDNAFHGRPERARPSLGEVAETMRRHAELLVECFGSETHGVLDFRKHVGWYLKGFTVGAGPRRDLATSSSLAELRERLAVLPAGQPWPGEAADGPRGKSTARERVHLPDGWLDDPGDAAVPEDAESATSGG